MQLYPREGQATRSLLSMLKNQHEMLELTGQPVMTGR